MKPTFNQLAVTILITCLLLIIAYLSSSAQDTMYMKKAKVPYNALVNKFGMVERVWYKKVKVKSGYIIRKTNGDYVINDRIIRVEDKKIINGLRSIE